VVIHDTGNTATAKAEANFAATRTDPQSLWTSCHAYVDTSGPLGSLSLNRQAWAAFSYANQHGLHIEMCGMNTGAPGAVPAATIAHTAALTAVLCDLAGIPKVHRSPAQVAAGASGICGHYDITRGLGVGDHDDPGPNFDWGRFVALVQAGGDNMIDYTQGAPAGALTGNPSRNVGQLLADVWSQTFDARGKIVGDLKPELDEIKALLATLAGKDAVVLTNAQVASIATTIADALVASGANGLSATDHAGVVADVKAALNTLHAG
jgi:hypothetical protein